MRLLRYSLLMYLLLLGLTLTLLKDSVNSQKHLPKDTLNKCSDDIDDGDMAETKEEHDISVVVRRTPAEIVCYHRPSSLCKDLHHHVDPFH